jgi:adenine phosphoribosyltransferase
MNLKDKIRSISGWPRYGVVFRDITTLLADHKAIKYCVEQFAAFARERQVTRIAAVEARGFIYGGALALELGLPLVPIRKRGKLPWDTVTQEYALEYGSDAIEMHRDAVGPEDRLLIVDDLLATGGTARAAVDLVHQLKAQVAGLAFVIELSYLQGRDQLEDYDLLSLVKYGTEGE